MVNAEHEHLSIRHQCNLLGVHRSGIYYRHAVPQDESILANEIHELWIDMPYYGYRRITEELKRRKHKVNHKKILRIMREMKIQAIYPRPKTTIHNPDHKIYPYLLRDLKIERPDQVWATDITYIKTPNGFMYLVAIIDLFSRYLIEWNLSNTLETSFCIEMFDRAISKGRKPEILNTDQGSQFTSDTWVQRVKQWGIQISMDGRGRWADNVFIERFWRTLKYEHIFLHSFGTVREMRNSIGQFIEIYKHKRLHQGLGYKTPAEAYL